MVSLEASSNAVGEQVTDLASLLRRLPEPIVTTLAVDDLKLHPSYGRHSNQKRLKKLRANWSPVAIGTITVSKRANGSLVVIDGNHRITVARDEHTPHFVTAKVFTGLSLPDEAALYFANNDALPQGAKDLFRAELAFGDPLALAIAQQVRDAGFVLEHDEDVRGHRSRNSSVRCIRSLQGIAVRYGPSHLYPTLRFFFEAFGSDAKSIRDYSVAAVANFLWAYRGQIDQEHLIFRASGEGYKVLQGQANSERIASDVTMTIAYIRVLTRLYNSGLRGVKRLVPWEQVQDVRAAVLADPRSLRQAGASNPRRAVWNEPAEM